MFCLEKQQQRLIFLGQGPKRGGRQLFFKKVSTLLLGKVCDNELEDTINFNILTQPSFFGR